MYLIAGLGNPGDNYVGHRHNIGFMVVDALADQLRAGAYRQKFKGHFVRATVGSEDVVLLKPMTFMNLSGESVQEAMRFFKVPLDSVLCVHDELDLPFGTLRLKVGGGTAGHNGLKSLIQHGGSPEFIRLRVGIDRPKHGRPEHHVLSDFSKIEREGLPDLLHKASKIAKDVVALGPRKAMNRHHGG